MRMIIDGNRVRRQRARRKLTQQALAERAGVSQSTVSRIEQGYVSSIDSLSRVADALGVSIRSLIACSSRSRSTA